MRHTYCIFSQYLYLREWYSLFPKCLPNQSLIPNYETTKTVLSDNSKASYTKKYVVNKDSWFACNHQSYNGYSWGNVFVNDIRVAGFRAMPIDEAHYAYSSTTFFAPKGSTIIINGAGGMTVNVSEIG